MKIESINKEVQEKVMQLLNDAPAEKKAEAIMQSIEMIQEAAHDELARCYFADNDLIAAGAMRALSEAGYRIPEDISVIGFDDMPMCTYITPPLSTVHVPKQYMGEIAVKRLAEIINSTSASHVKIEISTEIIKRKSC